jgi:hypothetical protein
LIFVLEPREPAKAAIGKRVTVVDYLDGRVAIRYNGAGLAYRTFDKVCQSRRCKIVNCDTRRPAVRTRNFPWSVKSLIPS